MLAVVPTYNNKHQRGISGSQKTTQTKHNSNKTQLKNKTTQTKHNSDKTQLKQNNLNKTTQTKLNS